jgi:hypothetical protein
MGMQIWMSWTIVIYILLSVWIACLDKKKGFFWGKKKVFLVDFFVFFCFSENSANFQCQNMEKETMILMLNVSHKVYFCNFGYLLFFHFNKVW